MQPPVYHAVGEDEALLSESTERLDRRRVRKPIFPQIFRWTAHPIWLFPIIICVNVSRGITMAPRIQVYRAIACRTLSLENDGRGLGLLAAAVDCSRSSDEVQARAAKIQASIVTLMNILSAITTGYWSRLGDAYGRKPVFAAFLLGAIVMELAHVLVLDESTIFGQRPRTFILLGPILEGFVGALSTFNGVFHAYTTDCTPPGSRARIFSAIQGMVYIGLSSGPWLSGFILPKSDKGSEGKQADFQVGGAFWLTIAIMLITVVYIVFVLPESRQPMVYESRPPSMSGITLKSTPLAAIRRQLRNFGSSLLIPFTIFKPRRVPGTGGTNYNLTLLGGAMFIYIISTAIYSIKYLYAQHVYNWSPVQLGHYMSLLWITRAINLLLLLPIIISWLKPKPTSDGSAPSRADIASEMKFDKRLAQCSLGLDCIADTLVVLSPSSSESTYIALSCLSSFTSGANPTLHSLAAVCLHACGMSETGALFGGIAILNSMAHILSPYVLALTYGATVSTYPKAIFALATSLMSVSLLLLSGINTRAEACVEEYDEIDTDGEEEDEPTEEGENVHDSENVVEGQRKR